MGTSDALLAAVWTAPDDDLPRLAYADWVEEHGDPDRAALIRGQIDLEAMPAGDPRREAVGARVRDLLAASGPVWAGPLHGLVEGYTFRRGFVGAVDLPLGTFPGCAAGLLRTAPIRRVRFSNPDWSDWSDFVPGPELARLTEIEFAPQSLMADPVAGVTALARSPHAAGLTSLGLRDNSVPDDAVETITNSPHLAGLIRLDLGDNELTDRAAHALAAAPHLGRLTRLDLDGNTVTDDGARALVAPTSRLTALAALDLSNTHVRDWAALHAPLPAGDPAFLPADDPGLRELIDQCGRWCYHPFVFEIADVEGDPRQPPGRPRPLVIGTGSGRYDGGLPERTPADPVARRWAAAFLTARFPGFDPALAPTDHTFRPNARESLIALIRNRPDHLTDEMRALAPRCGEGFIALFPPDSHYLWVRQLRPSDSTWANGLVVVSRRRVGILWSPNY